MPGGNASLEVERCDAVMVARVRGRLDVAGARPVVAQLAQHLTGAGRGLVVDLSPCSFADSVGLRLLYELRRGVETSHAHLRVVMPLGAPIRRILQLVQLEDVLPIDASVEDAVRRLQFA